MTHAMVFTGVSLDVSINYITLFIINYRLHNYYKLQENGKVTKLRVENSWGEDRGDKGYLVMTVDWFREFGFEVVVDKKHVPEDVLKVFDMDPIILPAWDPMGTLAGHQE